MGWISIGGGLSRTGYGWPIWFANYEWAAKFVVQPETMITSLIVTGHVAIGTLIIASSLWLALRSMRYLQIDVAKLAMSNRRLMGVTA